jgi:hypothetical protein
LPILFIDSRNLLAAPLKAARAPASIRRQIRFLCAVSLAQVPYVRPEDCAWPSPGVAFALLGQAATPDLPRLVLRLSFDDRLSHRRTMRAALDRRTRRNL